jgi:membrane associated rhomboid family serine protease
MLIVRLYRQAKKDREIFPLAFVAFLFIGLMIGVCVLSGPSSIFSAIAGVGVGIVISAIFTHLQRYED